MNTRAGPVAAITLGSCAVLMSSTTTWSDEGNLSSATLLRAVDLAASDTVHANAPVRAIEVMIVALVAAAIATAGVGARRSNVVRLVFVAGTAVGVGRLVSSDAYGSGAGVGLWLAVCGLAVTAIGAALGLRASGSTSPVARWVPPVVSVVAVGVVAYAGVVGGGLGADDESAARAGLGRALTSGDVIDAATYVAPDDLRRVGGVTLAVDAVAGAIGVESLSGEAAPGGLVSTVLDLGVELLGADRVDGRAYVRLPGG